MLTTRQFTRLELPEGMVMEKASYEVLLRYVLLDVINDEDE